jgi:hypothetical protein
MSKTTKTGTSAPTAIIRFNQAPNAIRTLNASQPEDKFQTYVSLSSHKGKFTDNSAAAKNSLDIGSARPRNVAVSSVLYQYPAILDGFGAKETAGAPIVFVPQTVTLSVAGVAGGPASVVKNTCCCCSKLTFQGTSEPQPGSSKATNSVNTYKGIIVLALGKWVNLQGSYAVLKTNSDTGKSTLRIFSKG